MCESRCTGAILMSDDQEIRIFLDGNMWCALRGQDLQVGESGFGETPKAALAGLLGMTDEGTSPPLEQYCPLLTDPSDGGALPCLGAECAWRDVERDKCSIVTIAAAASSRGWS